MSVDPKNYHHGDLKQSLMAAACKHLVCEGADSFSLRALAREVGVSQTAPYRHFRTKNCLFAAIAASGFEELTVALRKKAAGVQGDVVAVMIELGLGYVEWALANPEKYQLFFDSALFDIGQYPELQTAADACYNVLIENIEKGIEQGIFLLRPADELAGFMWSAIHGVTSLLLTKLHQEDRHVHGLNNAGAYYTLKNNTRSVVELAAKAISR